MINNNQIEWINISKTLCIYLVVLGHALNYDIPDEYYVRNFIYQFHLPVFFFISGFLYKIKEGEKFSSYLIFNLKTLIIPYIFLNILAIIITLPILLRDNIKLSLLCFLAGHGLAPAGPAWFLICLFWVKIQMFFIKSFNISIQIIISSLYGVIAYYFPWHMYWDIDASFMAMPIFIVGNLARKLGFHYFEKHYSNLTLLIVFIISISLTISISLCQGTEAMFSRMFGNNGLMYYLGSSTGILMIISISKLFEYKTNNFTSLISSGSIIIMGLHGIFYNYSLYIIDHVFNISRSDLNILSKSFICLVVILEMVFPILFLQKYCSQYLGGRKRIA